jgi:magnesium-transporting ATPase (P-type)
MLEEKKQTKLVSLKKKENLATAVAIREKVSLNKATFSQNTIFEHGHKQRVRRIQFSSNNKFMTTVSSDCVKLWRVGDHVIGNE